MNFATNGGDFVMAAKIIRCFVVGAVNYGFSDGLA